MTMVVLATFLAAWALIVVAPRTPVARFLHTLMVAKPAARLSRVSRGHVAFAALFAAVVGAAAWAGEADGLRMLSMAAPELATWITTFEVATYLDVAIAAVAAWTGLRSGSLRALGGFVRPRARGPRSARRRLHRSADNDDGPDRALPIAA